MKVIRLLTLMARVSVPTSMASSMLRITTGRFLQEAACSTSEEFNFTAVFLIDILGGQPGLWNKEASITLEQAITTTYACDSGGVSYYELLNVTAISPNTPEGGGPFDAMAILDYSVPVLIEGRTDLVRIQDGVYFEEGEMEGQQGNTCSCSPPSKQDFLESITQNTGITTFSDVRVFLEVDCPIAVADNITRQQDQSTVEFESGILLSVVGDAGGVGETFLQSLAQTTTSLYNSLNLLETCDRQFRRIVNAVAIVGAVSSDRGVVSRRMIEGLAENDIHGGGENDKDDTFYIENFNKSRSLQSINRPFRQVPMNSFSPAAAPSILPTSSFDPDPFTILIGVSAQCRGCPADNTLFNQVTAAAVRQLLENHLYRHDNNRELGIFIGTNDDDKCYCLPGTEDLDGITEAEFAAALELTVIDDDDLRAIDSITGVEEVRVFNFTNENSTNITSYIEATFLGNHADLTELEKMRLELSVIETYESLLSQVCDPFFRSVTGVSLQQTGLVSSQLGTRARRFTRKLQSDLPTSPPTSTSPSIFPSLLPTSVFAVDDDPDNGTGSTDSPTFAPTSGFAVPFYGIFEISGRCIGCSAEFSFYDQVTRSLQQSQPSYAQQQSHSKFGPPSSPRNLAQQYEGHDVCSCGLAAPDRGVSEADFASQWDEVIDELNLQNVESLLNVEFFDDPPPRLDERTTSFPSFSPTEQPNTEPSQSSDSSPSSSQTGQSGSSSSTSSSSSDSSPSSPSSSSKSPFSPSSKGPSFSSKSPSSPSTPSSSKKSGGGKGGKGGGGGGGETSSLPTPSPGF